MSDGAIRRPSASVFIGLVVVLVLGGCSSAASPRNTSASTAESGRTEPDRERSDPDAAGEDIEEDDEDAAEARLEQIRAMLADARPGDVIELPDGEYEFRPRLVASADGTADAPITLRGTRNAIIRSKDTGGDYGLSITGDYWRIEGITVAHASKGIVLDGSVGTVIDGVEVFDIGAEGVHFRSCSADGVLRNSYIHDTGIDKPNFGEGVYVGSANSNWDKYACDDGHDNSERVLIEGNTFRHISAEGADLKEGTDSGTVRNNVFDDVGYSGDNSADSAIDAKGNGWLIEGNTVMNGSGEFLDAFQTHSVYEGYGTDNVFTGNTVEGDVPGFGFGLYPALDNIVRCDNDAPTAALGLVGDGETPIECSD
jgi:hypothetical protein